MNIVRDPLDAQLKADAAEHAAHHIDDDGFTLAVMDALPVKRRSSLNARAAIPFGLAALAAVGVAALTPAGNFFVDGFMDIATQTMTGNALALLAFLGATAMVGVASALSDR
jgi:multisubunit Na+/H+ antiporter MnhB subunit